MRADAVEPAPPGHRRRPPFRAQREKGGEGAQRLRGVHSNLAPEAFTTCAQRFTSAPTIAPNCACVSPP